MIRVGANLVRLYKAGGRLTEEEKKLTEVQKENQALKDRLAEVQTPEFLEREAREKLGMGKEGEVVVVIPPEELQAANKQQTDKKQEPNWIKWRKLYLGW